MAPTGRLRLALVGIELVLSKGRLSYDHQEISSMTPGQLFFFKLSSVTAIFKKGPKNKQSVRNSMVETKNHVTSDLNNQLDLLIGQLSSQS